MEVLPIATLHGLHKRRGHITGALQLVANALFDREARKTLL